MTITATCEQYQNHVAYRADVTVNGANAVEQVHRFNADGGTLIYSGSFESYLLGEATHSVKALKRYCRCVLLSHIGK